jgi:hypothetical protein
MRISEELLAKIDAWRHAQSDKPARATAVKRLIAAGIETASTAKAQRKTKK